MRLILFKDFQKGANEEKFTIELETIDFIWVLRISLKLKFFLLFVVLLAQTVEERRGRKRRGTGLSVELGIRRVFYTLFATSKCVLNISREDSRQAAAQCNLDAQQPELVRKFLLYQATVQWLECLGMQRNGAPAPLIIGKQRFRTSKFVKCTGTIGGTQVQIEKKKGKYCIASASDGHFPRGWGAHAEI